MKPGRKRVYDEVSVAPVQGNDTVKSYAIFLDGKQVRTPAGARLAVPTQALAEAISEEWRAQDSIVHPETMPITRIAFTAIDRIAPDRPQAIAQICAFGRTDVVCYRAQAPAELAARQSQIWDPLLDWVEGEYGAALMRAIGIAFVEQPAASQAALERAVAAHDDFTLAALLGGAMLLGSTIIALALLRGRVTPDEAFAAAYLDEIYQAQQWGEDAEAQRRAQAMAAELAEIAQFLELLRKD